jgi:hypothetical protein
VKSERALFLAAAAALAARAAAYWGVEMPKD